MYKCSGFVIALLLLSLIASVWLLFMGGGDVVLLEIRQIATSADQFNRPSGWAVFFIVSIVTQLLVIPSGSLLLIAAGFVFSPLPAAMIFAFAQLLCIWPFYRLTQKATVTEYSYPRAFVNTYPKLASVLNTMAQNAGVSAGIVLRLTPVVPSALACLLAVGLGIREGDFLKASLLVSWIRPLFFAAIGGSLKAASEIGAEPFGFVALWPLLLIFAVACLLLLLKLHTQRLVNKQLESD